MLTGGAGLIVGGALGAGKNVVPIFLHLKDGGRRFINLKKKHLGKIEALLRILGDE